jgi:hypothetical protein
MRKKLYQAGMLGAMLTFGIIVMGCVTSMGTYSPSLQQTEPDKLCHLEIDTRLGISGFNGKPVHWGFARQISFTKIDIPSGLNSFRFEYFDQSENGMGQITQSSASNFTFSYEFMPGHDYKIAAGMGFGKSIVVFVTDKTDRKLSKTIPLRG